MQSVTQYASARSYLIKKETFILCKHGGHKGNGPTKTQLSFTTIKIAISRGLCFKWLHTVTHGYPIFFDKLYNLKLFKDMIKIGAVFHQNKK